MRSNPFYASSACAMLLGCWLLSEALHLQAGQLRGLLVLLAGLQLYEGALVGFGTYLVRSGRAPRDGATLLVIESLFLLDGTLLAAECVTADARVGTAVALLLGILAAVKLAWARRASPALLSRRAAILLGAHAVFVLALPAAAAHLAGAQLLGPRALAALWWTTLALPPARRALGAATRLDSAVAEPRWLAAWTWAPAALVMLHLWAVGYIHTMDFQPAFLAPFLLGLAVTARPDQLVRRVALPAAAVLVSLGQESALGWRVLGLDALFVSPTRLAVVAVASAWVYLAWRDRERCLAILATGCAASGAVGSSLPRVVGRAMRTLESILPRDTFGWGVVAVIAAFVLFVAGARRSLGPDASRPGGGLREPGAGGREEDGRPPRGTTLRGRDWAALSLSLVALAVVTMWPAVGARAGASSGTAVGLASLLAVAAAFAAGVRAMRVCVHQDEDPTGRRLAVLAITGSVLAGVIALSSPREEPRTSPPDRMTQEGGGPVDR